MKGDHKLLYALSLCLNRKQTPTTKWILAIHHSPASWEISTGLPLWIFFIIRQYFTCHSLILPAQSSGLFSSARFSISSETSLKMRKITENLFMHCPREYSTFASAWIGNRPATTNWDLAIHHFLACWEISSGLPYRIWEGQGGDSTRKSDTDNDNMFNG